jgi:hypothetical protein
LINLKKRADLGKSFSFFGAHFSHERDGKSNFKYDIGSESHYIDRLISRKFDFFGWLAALGITPVSTFWGLLVVRTAAYNIKMLVSGYPSIYMLCIVLPVKFGGRLSIFVLRNKQLFSKK